MAVPAGASCRVEGDVGVDQKLFRGHAGLLQRDPDACGDRLSFEDTRFRPLHGHEHLFGDFDRTINATYSFCQHQKFITRYPSGDVGVMETTEESTGGDREDLFAHAPTLGRIRNHKRVHRHGQKGETPADPLISCDCSPQVLEKRGTVEQAAQMSLRAQSTKWVRMVSDEVSHTASIDGSEGQLEWFRPSDLCRFAGQSISTPPGTIGESRVGQTG